jgi:hypothetical protein
VIERPNSDYGFDKVFETSNWIKNNTIYFPKIKILADTATQTLVNAQLGLLDDNRLNAQSLSSKIVDIGGTIKIHSDTNVTHVLALSKQPYLYPTGSILGKSSGHWDSQHLSNCLKYDPKLQARLDTLIKLGWTKKFIAPWYYSYERLPK